MTTNASYAMSRTVELTWEEADRRVRRALGDEGFGVLTEIDVRATMKNRLGVEFPRYEILGACNPTLAHQALGMDADIGLLLPCNVIVRDAAEPGKTVIAVLDPVTQLAVSGNQEMTGVAREVRRRMEVVLERVSASG